MVNPFCLSQRTCKLARSIIVQTNYLKSNMKIRQSRPTYFVVDTHHTCFQTLSKKVIATTSDFLIPFYLQTIVLIFCQIKESQFEISKNYTIRLKNILLENLNLWQRLNPFLTPGSFMDTLTRRNIRSLVSIFKSCFLVLFLTLYRMGGRSAPCSFFDLPLSFL